MQPMNMLELKYYLKDLERQAKRDEAFVSAPSPCVLCAMLSDALRRALRFLLQSLPIRSLHTAESR
jgi:hypothetical protein